MSFQRISFAAATLLLLSACATPMSKGSHCTVEPGYLGDQLYYSWHDEPAISVHDDTGYISPAMIEVLRVAVAAQLSRKGFTYVDSKAAGEPADLEIAVSLRTRRELNAIGVDDLSCTGHYCWERVDMGSNVRMNVHTIGFLSADAYHKGKPIWRGWVERDLYPADRDNADAVIGESVPALFENFPP